MRYRQTHLPEPDHASLELVIPTEESLRAAYPVRRSPFTNQPSYRRTLSLWVRRFLVRLTELLVGRRLYAMDELGPLKALTAETLALLLWLSREGYIERWRCNTLVPGRCPLAVMEMGPGPIVSPTGKRFTLAGATGNGAGATLEEAAVIGLAEFTERYSIASGWWERRDIVQRSVRELRRARRAFVDPAVLTCFTEAQESSYGGRTYFDETTAFRWLPARDYVTGARVLLPASVAYSFFTREYLDEPILQETTSNGAAAHTSWEEAEYRAVCELLERDAMMRAWYRCEGVKIDMRSVKSAASERGRALLNHLSAQLQLELSLFDVTTDLGWPTLCVVLRNRCPGAFAVGVCTATAASPAEALEKALHDAHKFLHFSTPALGEDAKAKLLQQFGEGKVHGLKERYLVWSLPESLNMIDDFLADAPTCTFNEVEQRHQAVSRDESPHRTLRRVLSSHGVPIYLVGFSNRLTRRTGLTVVRAVSPALVPVFFDERNLPLNRSRFTHDEAGERVPLRPVPHPFI